MSLCHSALLNSLLDKKRKKRQSQINHILYVNTDPIFRSINFMILNIPPHDLKMANMTGQKML
jgi:hypothetical protein